MAGARHAAQAYSVNTEIQFGQRLVKKRFNSSRVLSRSRAAVQRALFLSPFPPLSFFLLRFFFSIRPAIKQLNCSAEIGVFERGRARTCLGEREYHFAAFEYAHWYRRRWQSYLKEGWKRSPFPYVLFIYTTG